MQKKSSIVFVVNVVQSVGQLSTNPRIGGLILGCLSSTLTPWRLKSICLSTIISTRGLIKYRLILLLCNIYIKMNRTYFDFNYI